MFHAPTRPSSFSRMSLFAVALCAMLSALPASANADSAPVITYFAFLIPMEDYFVLYGMIEDEDPASCTILFGGPLEGGYTSVNEDGSFMLCINWNPGDVSAATATAYDASQASLPMSIGSYE